MNGISAEAAGDTVPPCAASASAGSARAHVGGFSQRLWAVIVAVAAASVLGLAAWLEPSPTGIGTHSQLNLPRCGWIITMDLPCPTCGMTTSFAHAADGNLAAAFMTQPLGAALALITAMMLLLCVHIAATGSRVAELLLPLARPRTGWILFALVLAAWGYKIVSHRGWI